MCVLLLGKMTALTTADSKPVDKKLYAHKVRFDELLVGLDWAFLDLALNSEIGRVVQSIQKIADPKQDGAIGP